MKTPSKFSGFIRHYHPLTGPGATACGMDAGAFYYFGLQWGTRDNMLGHVAVKNWGEVDCAACLLAGVSYELAREVA